MILTALIVTERQEFFHRLESAFHANNAYARPCPHHVEQAKSKLLAIQPDILLVDVMLEERTAFLLESLAEASVRRPTLFVCVEKRTPVWEQHFIRRGATYVFDQGISEQGMVECILLLYKSHRFTEREDEIMPELMRLLRECGLSSRHKGYACVVECVQMIYSQPGVNQSLTKKVYPQVAKQRESTTTKVEKNIRDAIRNAWHNKGSAPMQELLGCGFEKPPSNGHFISAICEHLRESHYGKERTPEPFYTAY